MAETDAPQLLQRLRSGRQAAEEADGLVDLPLRHLADAAAAPGSARRRCSTTSGRRIGSRKPMQAAAHGCGVSPIGAWPPSSRSQPRNDFAPPLAVEDQRPVVTAPAAAQPQEAGRMPLHQAVQRGLPGETAFVADRDAIGSLRGLLRRGSMTLIAAGRRATSVAGPPRVTARLPVRQLQGGEIGAAYGS